MDEEDFMRWRADSGDELLKKLRRLDELDAAFKYPSPTETARFTYNPDVLMKDARAREQDGEASMFEYPATRYTADAPGGIDLDSCGFEHLCVAEEMEKPRLDGDPAVADRVDSVAADILTGRATPMHRARLKGAIEKVEAPLTGRAKADAGLGRAIRFGGV